MTENEAIARMKYRIDTATDIAGKGSDGKAYEDMEMTIKALEEIQQYQAIGTIEECRQAGERQREKKRVLDSYCGFNSYECPVCGAEPVGGSNYCHECGQRLG